MLTYVHLCVHVCLCVSAREHVSVDAQNAHILYFLYAYLLYSIKTIYPSVYISCRVSHSRFCAVRSPSAASRASVPGTSLEQRLA